MRAPTPSSRRRTTSLIAVAAAGALTFTLAACSSSSDSAINPTADPSGSVSSTVVPGEVGGNPGTWTPVQISSTMKDPTIDMRVGQVATFVEFPMSVDGYTVVSKNPRIATATSSTDAEAAFGFVAVTPGQTEVSVYTGADTSIDPVYVVKVNVPNLDPAPAPTPVSSSAPEATPEATEDTGAQ